ncbi:hypothetical protein AB0M61_11635 [Streptomyces sp. NPDC051642]
MLIRPSPSSRAASYEVPAVADLQQTQSGHVVGHGALRSALRTETM